MEGVVSDVDGLEGKRTLWMCRKLVFLVSLFQYMVQMSFMSRGVQYVHWVMHKCIMVKVGGNEIHIKYVKSR